ncbi:hypothetical protein D7D52_09410 [Nocardia yunnanensis]|uniref:Uncharacterized protein n=1 Tax=Nocardia yunnanensis TaxID=2382165 RepID=A0A386Z9W6_9NOCA|nr:hypothetical protein [Nocardia yunnanensis]AYF74047.1 hypothetical protein D7D52_09410 [Nocardia yunnanensis]
MNAVSTLPELPAYSEFVSHLERAPARTATRWPFAVLAVLGVLLVAAPVGTGMFPRAAKGAAMIDAFGPYVTAQSIDGYRSDLRVLADARTNIVAVQSTSTPPGEYPRVDQFVRDYPGIQSDMSAMLDAIDTHRDNYRTLAGTVPFGVLPWLLALPGVVLTAAGVFGFRAAGRGSRATAWRATAALAGLALIVTPLAGGLFPAGPAAQPLIDGFRPILTAAEVHRVQGYFVTLVAADGELNSRYTAAVRTARPDAELGGITALEQRWQPMTSRFAALVGTMNDNVGNFDAVVALNDVSRPLGFGAFRGLAWGFAIPGALVLGLTVIGSRRPRTDLIDTGEGEPQ